MAIVNFSANRTRQLICVFAVASLASAGAATLGHDATVPRANEILHRFLEAAGGRGAWEKLHSRVSKGTVEIPQMKMSGTAEMWEKAPDRALVKIVISGSEFLEGFDGTVGWSSDPKDGLQEQTGAALDEIRRESDFRLPVDFGKLYAKVAAGEGKAIKGRPTYVIEATTEDGGDPDRAYFDAESGLLVRMVTQHHVPDGSVEPFEEDFEDYRTVDGVKIPFTIHQSGSQVDFTIRINEVQQNVEVDEARFSKPVAR